MAMGFYMGYSYTAYALLPTRRVHTRYGAEQCRGGWEVEMHRFRILKSSCAQQADSLQNKSMINLLNLTKKLVNEMRKF